ncbi:hypothetical protein J2X06_001667 [Lysobacter niastensis]|uniref:CHRD domain-containing protein n=1 Tax=Lysobacter niastensis TaxID=380629 RepID=A0ABU1WAA1_9GAMM|nr:CHRD domain-containing protein [Lysobacter niastensis]MDR7134483.1 hypothetical protein [Lysobacter niastensis]
MRLTALLAMAALLPITAAQADNKVFKAELVGEQEVPAISTGASGGFKARVTNDGQSIQYELAYADLEGGNVLQAHIHIGQKSVNGGIAAFLCTNLGNGPVGTQPCPAPPAVITGTITAADVVGPNGQGVAPGQLDELIRALRGGFAYANVHTVTYPGGEIRSQLGHDHGNGHDNDD